MLGQSHQSNSDATTIAKFITKQTPKRVGYAHYDTQAQLCSIPDDDQYGRWTPNRVSRALVDAVDDGWSPFGGSGQCYDVANLWFSLKVYTE